MQRQIPLHLPQTFPAGWNHSLIPIDTMPTKLKTSHINIDAQALVYAAMHAFSSTTVPEITNAGGGNSNAILSIQFPDGFRVAARIPFENNRAPGDRKGSVVAMMTFARFYAGLPVPEVYTWHPDDTNPVGAPYILMEWVEGAEPSRKWEDLLPEDRTFLLDEIASYHAKFAKPLPFQGIGSVYFADLPPDAPVSFDDVSVYRLRPFFPGPMYTWPEQDRGILSWPQAIPTSLRDFWLQMWQHEVDSITKVFGSDDRSVDVTQIFPASGYYFKGSRTFGDLLDAASAMHSLIEACPLPSQSQADLYTLCFVTTDYAFRNLKIDPVTLKITSLLDWDDVYVLPFLLCSRYPEDICWSEGSDEQWEESGAFPFLPSDEEGEYVEGSLPKLYMDLPSGGSSEVADHDSEGTSECDGEPEGIYNDDEEIYTCYKIGDEVEEYDALPDEECADYNTPRRRKDTMLRRQYEQMLISHDPRFGTDGFWETRKDLLKVNELVMRGWIEWLVMAEWVNKRVEELKRL